MLYNRLNGSIFVGDGKVHVYCKGGRSILEVACFAEACLQEAQKLKVNGILYTWH